MSLLVAGRPLLGPPERARLRANLSEGARRARRHGECLVALTVALAPGADPTAIVAASRRPGEDWFCFEQPDRDGFALAALGCVDAIEERGAGRFRRVAARWRKLAAGAVADPAAGRAGVGPDAVGVGAQRAGLPVLGSV